MNCPSRVEDCGAFASTMFCRVDANQGFRTGIRCSGDMGAFSLFFVDHAGHILGVEEIEAATDQEAIEQALRRYDCGIGKGCEIWRDDRRIYAQYESRLSHH